MKLANTVMAVALAALVLPAYAQEAREPEEEERTPARTSADASEQMGDAWITTKVKADLMVTEGVAGTAIDVDTENGVVTLNGTVESKAEADKAVEIAKGIRGVTDVKSQLKVAPPTP